MLRPQTAVIIDASPLFRESLAQLMRQESTFGTIGETGDKHLGMFYMDRFNPDLVILDLHMKHGVGMELLRYTQNTFKDSRVILMTDRDDSEELMTAVHLQADGYISKLIEVDELLSQIRRVAQGEVVVSNRLMTALTRAFRGESEEGYERDLKVLTAREKDVLKCLAIGMSNQDVANYLNITLGTVKVHVKHLLKKMSFDSRTQAALWAKDRGLGI